MAGLEKFLFDLKFDAPDPAPEEGVGEEVDTKEEEEREPEPPPPPMFSEEQLAAAKQAAYAEGTAEGEKKATVRMQETQEQRLAVLLESLGHGIGELLATEAARVVQSREMTMQIAIAVARKILPDYIRREGSREIEAVVSQILPHLMEEPRLIIKCHPSTIDTVSQKLNEQTHNMGYEGKLVYTPDPTLSEADCLLEWAAGGLERDVPRIWESVDRLITEVQEASASQEYVDNQSPSTATAPESGATIIAEQPAAPSPTLKAARSNAPDGMSMEHKPPIMISGKATDKEHRGGERTSLPPSNRQGLSLNTRRNENGESKPDNKDDGK